AQRGITSWRFLSHGSPGSLAGARWGGVVLAPALLENVVRAHDRLHDPVAHDVAMVEAHETDRLDSREDALGLLQAGDLPRRQVDLRDVARDDGLRAEADARQEHLHLLLRRAMSLVEDDEG